MKRSSYIYRLCRANVRQQLLTQRQHQLHTTAARYTDGVYPALTEMRVKIPWIEALKNQNNKDTKNDSTTPTTPTNRDLTPKRMSESYHRVVESILRG